MCEFIYIASTQEKFKKIMDSHFSDILRLLKNGQKSDSLSAYLEQNFNFTNSLTYLIMDMTFKGVKQLKVVCAMKTFTKLNYILCMEECPTIFKNIRDTRVTIMNNNFEIYWAYWNKATFRQICLSTDDPVFNGWMG